MSFEENLGMQVRELMANPSVDKRQEITDKISNYFSNDIFNESEKKIALDVLRLLTKDSETRVRKTLSHNLKFNKDVPEDIILTLANDVDEVANPILEYSTVLSQENLISIVKGCNQLGKLIAIARRADIKNGLSEALVDTDQEQVVKTLVANNTAEISENTMMKTLNKFAKSGIIMEAIVERGGLPYVIVERIMSQVSEDLRQKLIDKYKVKDSVATEMVNKTREDLVLEFLSGSDDKTQKLELVNHLFANGKLTHSMVLRSLCKGDLEFFIYAIAKLSNMGVEETRKIILKEGVTSFSAIYKKAEMPKGTFDAVNIILRFTLQDLDENGNVKNLQHFPSRMIEKIIEGGFDTKVSMMKYFMVLMKSKVDSINDNTEGLASDTKAS